ncbi:MAG TPA: ATP-binding cassette domain-containing protein [Thermosynergistes sp.]|nr:ATP-binding cassette domain-containing protein [Thermosynergistes sp.]
MALLAWKDLVPSLPQEKSFSSSGEVKANEILLLQGPSGAGKTTLLRTLARLHPRASGNIWLNEKPCEDVPPPRWRRSVHYVAPRVLANATVLENIMYPFRFSIYKKETPPLRMTVTLFLSELGLDEGILTQEARTLSSGEVARVALIRAILIEPVVLLLDEPAAPLDKKAKENLASFLSRWVAGGERGILLVSHQGMEGITRAMSINKTW